MRGKSAQNIIFQGWVVTSGHSRVFFQGQTKSRVFQGLPGCPGFVGHPTNTHIRPENVVNWHKI